MTSSKIASITEFDCIMNWSGLLVPVRSPFQCANR